MFGLIRATVAKEEGEGLPWGRRREEGYEMCEVWLFVQLPGVCCVYGYDGQQSRREERMQERKGRMIK